MTGAAGFLGTEVVRVLRSQGHEVFGLTRSIEGAERVRLAGAVPVIGDLFVAGQWQDEAAADWVFHIAPRSERGVRLTRRRGKSDAHVLTDANLLDTVATGNTQRVVYVADACYYGTTGVNAITEEHTPRPLPRGTLLTPALNRLDGYVVTGLPIVSVFPGVVYGYGSWFQKRVADPLMTGRRVLRLGSAAAWVSPVHVHDCARALVHLAEHGESGGRYFVVNTEPTRMRNFAGGFAERIERPLRFYPLPPRVTKLLVEPALADYLRGNALFSNIRLRATGFRFAYPTVDDGMRQIVGALHE